MAGQTVSPAPPLRAGPALLKRLKRLPEEPGVYLFKDAHGVVLYVGKASNLRARVSSYFHLPGTLSPRARHLVARIADLDLQLTGSDAEALLLESQLIKAHRPKYNIAYRDDKSYPMLKITNEPFPRLMVTRQPRGIPRGQRESGRSFGPYPDAGALHDAVRFFRRVFPMRTCRTFPKTPCLEYHLGQCLAPCAGYIDRGAYDRIVGDLVAFLEGKRDGLLRDLSRRMEQASRRQDFEEAARLRDQIQSLTSVIVAKEKSSMTGPLEQLQLALKLPVLPARIEAFDISNIYGAFAVGSMVTFANGKPLKAHYRRFTIKTVRGIDDYQMMREILRRRYGGSLSQTLPLPNLIVVDGGKGQLSFALQALQELSLAIPAIGLAKRFEQIFLPGQSTPVVLLPTSPVLHLIQHLRDEAHRFAVSYHRKRRAMSLRDEAKTVKKRGAT